MRFRLSQKTPSKFRILYGETVVGSVCVEPEEVPELLKCWAGPVELTTQMSVPRMRFGKPRPMSRQAILRGCL
jgi:hypothetical protein